MSSTVKIPGDCWSQARVLGTRLDENLIRGFWFFGRGLSGREGAQRGLCRGSVVPVPVKPLSLMVDKDKEQQTPGN